jgi:hypothetical protein
LRYRNKDANEDDNHKNRSSDDDVDPAAEARARL